MEAFADRIQGFVDWGYAATGESVLAVFLIFGAVLVTVVTAWRALLLWLLPERLAGKGGMLIDTENGTGILDYRDHGWTGGGGGSGGGCD